MYHEELQFTPPATGEYILLIMTGRDPLDILKNEKYLNARRNESFLDI